MINDEHSYFNGYRIFTDINMTIATGTVEIKRTWMQRLFSRPWEPMVSKIIEITYEPSREVIKDEQNHALIVHPSLFDELKRLANE